MITIQIDGKKYIPSETLWGITRVPEMIQQYIEVGALEEVKENKDSILEKLREELDKIYKDRIDKNYEENSPEHYKAYGQYLMYQRLYYFLNSLEQPKEESQPQEDIELLPAYEPRAEDMSHDSATFDPAEWQLKLITDRLNQLIKANKKLWK